MMLLKIRKCVNFLDITDNEFVYKILPSFSQQLTIDKLKLIDNYPFAINTGIGKIDPKLEREPSNLLKINCETKYQIYIIWFIMWCMTFKYTHQYEHLYRVYQLLQITRIFENDFGSTKHCIPIFEDVFKVLLEYGNFEMMNKIISMTHILKIKPNSAMYDMYYAKFKLTNQYQENDPDFINHHQILKQTDDKGKIKLASDCERSIKEKDDFWQRLRAKFEFRTFKEKDAMLNWMIKDVCILQVTRKPDKAKPKQSIVDDGEEEKIDTENKNTCISCKGCGMTNPANDGMSEENLTQCFF